MRQLRAILLRLRGLFDGARRDREFAAEIESHLALHVDENLRAGMTPEEARRQARLKFGSLPAAREAQRERGGLPAIDSLRQDVRYALRTLRRAPAFAAASLGTIALGVGATVVMFAVVDAVLLKPLPFRDAPRLYLVHEVMPALRDRFPLITVNVGHFLEWQKICRAFEESAAIAYGTQTLTGRGEPQAIGVARVSPHLFTMLGVTPQLGRAFTTDEGSPGRDTSVVLGEALWRRRYAADPGIIGEVIQLDGKPFTVVGVASSAFQLPTGRQINPLDSSGAAPELFLPLAFTAQEQANTGNYNHTVIVRLRAGWSREQALAELNAAQATIARTMSAPPDLQGALSPLQAFTARDVSQGLWLLMAAVGVVQVIICVNLANLLLARHARRRQEFALRAALGAGRGRLLRQVLIESVLLGVLGGLLGLAVATLGLRALLAAAPVDLPRAMAIGIDARVALFGLALSVVTGVCVGLLPALRLRATAPGESLKAAGRAKGDAPRGAHLRRLLIGAQAALCTILLVVCGLLLGSFARVMDVDKGFEASRIASADFTLSGTRYAKSAITTFERTLLDRLQALSGVQSAATVQALPLRGSPSVNAISALRDTRPMHERPVSQLTTASARYFETMGIRLVRGRTFSERDGDRRVAVVSEAAATRLWPDADPIGQQFRAGDDTDPATEVVGVVANVRGAGLDAEPEAMIYIPSWQDPSRTLSIVVRGSLPPAALASALRETLRQIDPELPSPDIRTMEAVVSNAVAQRRFQALVVSAFAASAVLLASLGIFGVISHLVAARTSEIGLRMALGAEPRDLRALVLGQGLRPVLAGVIAGVAGALAAGHALRALLFNVSPFEPAILAGACAVLIACALAACYLPARRATQIDPLRALRSE